MALKMADTQILRLIGFICALSSLVSGQVLYPQGSISLTHSAPPQDIKLPSNIGFPFYGQTYNTLYISKDGLIGFSPSIRYVAGQIYGTQQNLYSAADDYPFVAPFNFAAYPLQSPVGGVAYDGKVYYRVLQANNAELLLIGQYINGAFIGMNSFVPKFGLIVTWRNVSDVNEVNGGCVIGSATSGRPCKRDTFQAVLLTDGNNSYAIFNYDIMNIGTIPTYQSGFNAGSGRGWTEALSSADLQNANILKGSNMTGRFMFKIDSEVILRGGCNGRRDNTGPLQVFPRYGGMLGGQMLDISGPCIGPSDIIKCKFGTNAPASLQEQTITTGIAVNMMKARCEIPSLTERGQVILSMSVNEGRSYYYTTNITVVHPARMTRYVTLQNNGPSMMWNETSATTLTLTWDMNILTNDSNALVDVRLVGYKEQNNYGQWSMRLDLCTRVLASVGSCTFNVKDIKCNADCSTYEIGFVEVRLQDIRKATYYRSISSVVIPLGWLMNRNMLATYGSNWPHQKCLNWHSVDSQDTSWLSKLEYCPCTLQQALTDIGRWQTDVGCDLYSSNPNKCRFHLGAVHCVRAVQPTPQVGAGNQCCYGADGGLKYAADSFQGSTPDRSHDWGAYPYMYTNYVPVMSHWIKDVITFYYCCLWTGYNDCDYYMDLRATRDCTGYVPPKQAMVFGQSHVLTFDGAAYRVCGEGDFILLQGNNNNNNGITIEGRFQKSFFNNTGSNQNRSVTLTDVGIEINMERIEVRLRPPSLSLATKEVDILVNNQYQNFNTKSLRWQDFKEVSIVNNDNQNPMKQSNFTIIAKNGMGIQVAKQDTGLTLLVVIPPTLQGQVQGLLGNWNGSQIDDFLPKGGNIPVQNTNLTQFYSQYQYSWAIQNKAQSIVPFTVLAQNTSTMCRRAPTSNYQSVCNTNAACMFDYWSTGNQNLAQDTRVMSERYSQLTRFLQPVRSCGLLNVPRSYKNTNNYTLGSSVTVTGCRKGSFSGVSAYTCVSTSNVSQQWSPAVTAKCTMGNVEGADVGMIVGIIVAVLVVVVGLVVAIVLYKKRKSQSREDDYKERRREDPPNPLQAEYKSVPVQGESKAREYSM